jgi:steroid 5-alpha reductase family enzyme
VSRAKVALWLFVLAPVWPLLLALAVKDGRIPAESFGRVGALYVATHPVTSAFIVGVGYGIFQYFIAIITRNASIFDVHWSVLPASVYVIHYALHPSSHPDALRWVLVTGAIWAWGMRLTGNWLKKGGLGFEDFRYQNYRRQMSPVVFQVFSFWVLFVLQSAMVLAMTMPAWYALRAPGRPVGALDWIALAIVLGAIAIEWIADLQGMAFRARREAHRKLHPEDLEGQPEYPRFPTQGLWRYSRHPNYFGEIMVWWGIYLFAVAQSGEWLNWTIVGPLTINGLFLGGSIALTEKHELSRKPEYAEYQRRTSRLVPWFPAR